MFIFIVYLHSVSDVAKEDLLSQLDECINFIAAALQSECGSILVHWYKFNLLNDYNYCSKHIL